MEPSKPPRVFISYSWESEDHKNWVRYLGEKLYKAGIVARLDQWFVRLGESFTAFMEQEVEVADFVLVVCTPSYARKSNNRQGGVGYEQQIVSGQLMSGTPRSKFIPILRKGDYKQGPDCAIPTHFLGVWCVDFRDDAAFEEKFEDLIRGIFSKPRYEPPPLGDQPPLETITETGLNRIRLTEADESREHHLNIKKDAGVKNIKKDAGVKNVEKDDDVKTHFNPEPVRVVKWSEADSNYNVEMVYIIAEQTADGWKFFERNMWDIAWRPIPSTQILVSKAMEELDKTSIFLPYRRKHNS